MELTTEEKKELVLLSGYFKKLEITSGHLGVELDDYISEFRDNGYAHFVAKELTPKTSKRKEAFQKASHKGSDKVKTTGVK